MHIWVVAGTRPEIVKLAPVYRALRARPGLSVSWVATGQHSSLAEQAYGCFEIVPDRTLDTDSAQPRPASVAGLLGQMIMRLDAAIAADRPDFVVAQGDTSSAVAASLAAFGNKIPVGHVEAGLRTHDLKNPFPEEAWRTLIGKIADLHFAPTARAAENLKREGVAPAKLFVTGNTVIDALQWLAAGHLPPSPNLAGRRSVLVTMHRRENWGAALIRVGQALRNLARRFPDIDFRFVAHANPVLRREVETQIHGQANLTVLDPMDYVDFIAHMRAASLIMTDSGGIQEEAPAFGVPVLILRDSTERPEAVEAGVARLVGSDPDTICEAAGALLADAEARTAMARTVNPFGDGHAAERIAAEIEAYPTNDTEAMTGNMPAA